MGSRPVVRPDRKSCGHRVEPLSRPSLTCTAPGSPRAQNILYSLGMGDRGLHLCTWPPSLSILTCEVGPCSHAHPGRCATPAGLAMELKAAFGVWDSEVSGFGGAEGGMEAGLYQCLCLHTCKDRKLTPVAPLMSWPPWPELSLLSGQDCLTPGFPQLWSQARGKEGLL